MRLVLQPMTQPDDGGVAVGTFDGLPCVFHGRVATVGDQQYEAKAIAAEILAAVEVNARAVFGPEWVQSLALVSGLNPRTVQRDRIGRFGLPAHILRALAEAADDPWPRVTGDMMQACARLLKTNAYGNIDPTAARAPRFDGPPAGDVHLAMGIVADRARSLVERLASNRATHRAPALEGE